MKKGIVFRRCLFCKLYGTIGKRREVKKVVKKYLLSLLKNTLNIANIFSFIKMLKKILTFL